MTDEDKKAIERYARAHYTNPRIEEMRQAAIEAHRRNLRDPKSGENPREGWNSHMRFMSEVDTPVPDYVLRATYRKQLLGGT